MAGDDHENLLDRFPAAVRAECDGYGWVDIWLDNGYAGRSHCPVCDHARLLDEIAAFIPPRFRGPVTLPSAVTDWVGTGREAQGLYLAGPVGTGKTHTAWATVAAWCRATSTRPVRRTEVGQFGWHAAVIFTRVTDLLDDLRPGDEARQRVRDCQHAALLVLDDIGAEKASEWTQERLYSIADHRYANCLPLIVTSNLPPSKLAAQTGERTASRLAEMCTVVPMTGTDRRKPAA